MLLVMLRASILCLCGYRSNWISLIGTGGRGANATFNALTLINAVVNFCYFWVYNILSFLSCLLVDLFVDILLLSCFSISDNNNNNNK